MDVPSLEPGDELSHVYVPLRDRAREHGIVSLSDVERHILAVYRFLSNEPIGYLNGFLTAHPETANHVPAAFEAMGAAEAAGLFKRCLALFPGGAMPEDEDEAWELRSDLAASSPELWLELEEYTTSHHDDLVAKLKAFAAEHRDVLGAAGAD